MKKAFEWKNFGFILVFIGLFALLLVLVEGGLRIAGYGINTEPFVKPKNLPSVYVENLSFLNKYYNYEKFKKDEIGGKSLFPVTKPKNALRGFVLGESTAEGFPFKSNHSFGKIAELALKETGRYSHLQIINAGYSAMSSYYVVDMAKKLLKYKPDFLIIYSGHNEYYGTISATTGGNFWTKHMYLALKEFKLFQLIFNILDNGQNKAQKYKTLMEKQFANKTVPLNAKRDKAIADDYIRNLNSVIKLYDSKKIPVIVIEPICNLYDMPPFAGQNDKDYSELIRKYYEFIALNDKSGAKDYFNIVNKDPNAISNANLQYLNGQFKVMEKEFNILPYFVVAKELDAVPFRARNSINIALQEYINFQGKKYKQLNYIPLYDNISKEYSNRAFDRTLFIDHLHFNMQGQIIVSKYIVQKMLEIFPFNEADLMKVRSFYGAPSSIPGKLLYFPLHEMLAYGTIKDLINQSPYKEMKIPFNLAILLLKQNEILNNKELMKIVIEDTKQFGGSDDTLRKSVMGYYLAKKDLQRYGAYLLSDISIFPGEFWPYLNLAQFNSIYKLEPGITCDFYEKAYLLSGKKKEILDTYKTYFPKEADALLKKK